MSITIKIQERERGIPLAEWDKKGVAAIADSPAKMSILGMHVVWCGGDHYHVIEATRGLNGCERERMRVLPLDPAALAAALASVPVVEPEVETIDIQEMKPGEVGEYVRGCRFPLGTLVQCVRFRSGTMLVLPSLGTVHSLAGLGGRVRLLNNVTLTAEE